MWRPHPYFDSNSIRHRLFRLVVVVAVAVLVISMAGGALFEWNHQQRQVRQSLMTAAQAVGVAASAAVAFHDSSAASGALRILVARKEIEAAALYPLEGYRLAGFGGDAWLPSDLHGLPEHLPNFSLFGPSTTLFQPITVDDSTVGYIFIRASLTDYRATFLKQAALAIGANLLGLLLAVGFGLRFLDGILRPVQELADTSRQVRENKNFSLRAKVPDENEICGEIGELIVSFNAMLAEIERRERDLKRYHSDLEHVVLKRTKALHAANRDLLQAKEAAELASASKSRFLAAASHDLRQPIQAINLFQNALNRTDLNAEQKRISDYLLLSAESLGELLNALLDISELDAGGVVAKPRAISVHELFTGIEAEFAPIAAAKNLRFKLCFPSAEMAVFADSKLLQSIMRNLVGNALKYTTRGGILVAIRRRGDQAIIQVFDTGIGIAPEHIGAIFEEYFQVSNPERDKAKGLGLGLGIAQRQARLLATEIVCRSHLGRGSVFELRLPLAAKVLTEEPASIEPESIGAEATSSLAGVDVAVIEDDVAVAHAIQISLELLGMRVTTHGSAEEALADPGIGRAEVYVTDYRLPGANGLELLDVLQQRATTRIKAVLLTGGSLPDQSDAPSSARWPVLIKPVDLPTLTSAIRSQAATR